MEIRKATKKDSRDIIVLFKEEYAKPPYNEKWTDETADKKINDYFKDSIIYVAVDSEVIGFIIFSDFLWDEGKRGMIDEVVVKESEQGKGIGRRLIDVFENYCKKNGIKKASLMSVKSSKAFQIYNKMGYKEQDLVQMTKELK